MTHHSEYHPSDPRRHDLAATEIENERIWREQIEHSHRTAFFLANGVCEHCGKPCESDLSDSTVTPIAEEATDYAPIQYRDVLVHREPCRFALREAESRRLVQQSGRAKLVRRAS